jgi:Ca-activated chloride channel family protein
MAGLVAGLSLVLAPMSHAKQVDVSVSVSNPVIPSGITTTTYVHFSLTGLPIHQKHLRAPVNLAIVLDKSGSMQGEKIRHAKIAAINAVRMLQNNDIVSIVTYDDNVHVLVPATKASDRHNIIAAIERIHAGGATALFGGVSKGAHEVRKFKGSDRVNRIILLSDGLANRGPSTPGELGALGRSLGGEGITVSTIGLGLDYNEDLMAQLAMNSDGNHMFAETPEDVARAFAADLGDALSVVAQEISIVFNCANGIRPVRVIGRDAEISGQRVRMSMNQLYGEQTKFMVLEVEVSPTATNVHRSVGTATIQHTNMQNQITETHEFALFVEGGETLEAVEKNEDKKIMTSVVQMKGVETNKRALELRDVGKLEEAKEALRSNVVFLYENAEKYDSEELKDYSVSNDLQIEQFDQDDATFKRSRKAIREEQHSIQTQQKSRVK